MAPSGGATIVVDHAMTWSPENSRSDSLNAYAMWLAVWPGVVTASMVQPSPLTTSPSASATSGAKSMSAEASSRRVSPMCSGRASRCGPSAKTFAPVAALTFGTPGE